MCKFTRFILLIALLFSSYVSFAALGDPTPLSVVTSSPTETKVLSASSLLVYHVTIQAKSGNAGTIRLGGATASATLGLELAAGASVSFSNLSNGGKTSSNIPLDLNKWYFYAANSGDGVNILYVQH